MNQICRLTRLDLDNPDTVFLLQLSFRVKVRGETAENQAASEATISFRVKVRGES